MRGKGPEGKTIKEAVCETINELKKATGIEIFERVKKVHHWGDHAIWRHIMGQTINLQPGYYEWNYIKNNEKCLFLM
jgi:hypothetical protein